MAAYSKAQRKASHIEATYIGQTGLLVRGGLGCCAGWQPAHLVALRWPHCGNGLCGQAPINSVENPGSEAGSRPRWRHWLSLFPQSRGPSNVGGAGTAHVNPLPAAWPHLAGSMPRLAPSQLRSTKGHRKHTQQAGGTSEVRQREGLPGGKAKDKETGCLPSCCQRVFRGGRSGMEHWGAGTCPRNPAKI